QRALAMTFPASPKRASERCFSSAMEAKSPTGFKPDEGSGVAAETASPTPRIAIAPAKVIAALLIRTSSGLSRRTRERQREHVLARELRPGVGDCRCDRRRARLPDTGRVLSGGHDM